MKIKHLLSIMFLCLIPLVMLAQPFGQLVRKFNLTHKGTGPITCNKNYLFVGNATNDTIFIYNVNDGNYTGFKKIIFTDWGFFSTDTRFFLNADDYTLVDFDISNINNWSIVQTVAGLDRGWMASWANDSSMIAWNGHWAGSYQFFDISAGTLVEKCKVSTGGNPYSATRYQNHVYVANAYNQDRRIDISDPSSCAGAAWGSSYGMLITSTNSGYIINDASLSTAPFLIDIRNQSGTLTGSLAGQQYQMAITLPDDYIAIKNTDANNTVLYNISDGTFNHPVKTIFNKTLGDYTYNSKYILRIVNDSCEVYSRFSPNLQATNITFSNDQSNQLSINWTDGDGSKRAVFINQDTLGSPLPVFNTTYTANTILGSGSQIGSSGWYCVFNGTTHPDGVSVTNLLPDKKYKVMVCEYNGTIGAEQYNTSTAINNPVIILTQSISCPSSFIDSRDGKTYHGVQIGNQCWMKENLNIGTRINGSELQTNNGIIEKYSYNDNESNSDSFGGLYQWDEAMQYSQKQGAKGICPDGWYLPSDDEWKILEGSVDSQNGVGNQIWNQEEWRGYDAGKNLKSKYGWNNNGNGIDLRGFTSLASGYYYGGFDLIGDWSYFWTSSQKDDNGKWCRGLNYLTDKIYRTANSKGIAFSIRCVKDNTDYTPTSQASNVSFPIVSTNQLTLNWTDGTGNSRAVFINKDTTEIASPVNSTAYIGNSSFSSGTQIGTTGWYCIFNGNSHTSDITITNLEENTSYKVMVCDYNGATGSEQYNTSSAVNNPKVQKTSCNSNPIPINGLVAMYPFDGNANDASGNGNNGTVYGATLTMDRFGNPNSAYSFNGSTDYIDVANSPSLNTSTENNTTICGWVNNTSVGGEYFFLGVNYATSAYQLYDGDTLMAMNYNWQYLGGEWYKVKSKIKTNLNTWYFITAVFDYSNSVIKLYVNGELNNQLSCTIGRPPTPNIVIGRNPWPEAYMNGEIDDLRLYNRVLSDCEIMDIYKYKETTSFIITAMSNPVNGGSTEGTGTYQNGTPATLKASPNPDWSFVNWTENGSVVSTDLSYTFMVSDNRNLIANFISTVGIDESESNIKIFPNPTTGIIDIQSAKKIENIVIFNSTGVKVFNKTVNKPTSSLNLSQYGKGVYSIQMTIGEKVMIRKVIVL